MEQAVGHVVMDRSKPATSAGLRTARMLTVGIILLAAVASAGGLFITGLYRDPAGFVPALQGQDLVTLVTMPVLAVALLAVGRGSARATMVWIGLLSYMLYTYTGAAFAYSYNEFFLIYVALFSLTSFTLVAAVKGIDVAALRGKFDARAPRRPVGVFLSLIALMLMPMELGQNIGFLTAGTIPEIITRSGGSTCFVYVLDLGVIVPLAILAAVWLWKRMPWGDVLAGCILIKGATMGLALLSMDWFAVRAGQASDGMEIMWAIIAFGSIGMAAWILRHCRG